MLQHIQANKNKKQNNIKEKIERGTFYCGIKFGLHVLQLSSKLFANDFTVIFQMGESKIVIFFSKVFASYS